MDKREKVVKGFEFCANDDYDCENEGCPYNDLYGKGCIGQLKLDAYELLKDPDRVKVVRCGDCRYWEPPTKEEVEDGCTYGRCRSTGAGADVNDFCSSGKGSEGIWMVFGEKLFIPLSGAFPMFLTPAGIALMTLVTHITSAWK